MRVRYIHRDYYLYVNFIVFLVILINNPNSISFPQSVAKADKLAVFWEFNETAQQ